MSDPKRIVCLRPWHRVRTRPRCWLGKGEKRWCLLVNPLLLRMVHVPWHGTFLSVVEYTGTCPLTPRILRSFHWETFMKRRSAVTKQEAPKHLAAVETNLLADCLPLVEHCTMTRWDDGEPRQPGWLQIRTLGNDWVVTAKEPDQGLMLQVRAENLDDALFALAAHLGSPDAPWQEDPYAAAPKNKGKKKA